MLVGCVLEQSVDDLVKQLRDWLRVLDLQSQYQIGDKGRDWVTLRFVGTRNSDEVFPQAYMDLNDHLVLRGYVRSGTQWGGTRFMPKPSA